jgi:hypothetical protein
MSTRAFVRLAGLLILASAFAATVSAQKRPKAELTPTVVTRTVHAGQRVRVSLNVKLEPANVHVQSDKPHDKALIPTVLTIEAPPNVTVEKISYPRARDLTLQISKEPVAVFGPEFTIFADLTLRRVAAGDLVIPAQLRYQACDDAVCYPPTKADTKWTLSVQR